jgi:hypothetical protein
LLRQSVFGRLAGYEDGERVFNQFGDVKRCAMRPGNVHSAAGWRAVLEPVVARYRGT